MTVQAPGGYFVRLAPAENVIRVLAASVLDAVELAKLWRGESLDVPRLKCDVWRILDSGECELVQ